MGTVLKILAFIGIVAAAIFLWVTYRPQPTPPPPPVVVAPPPAVLVKPDLTTRTWTAKDGRTFEGALITVKNEKVVIRRMSDSAYFKVPLNTFVDKDREFVLLQLDRAEKLGIPLGGAVPSVYTLVRKLEIKGFLVRVAASQAIGGWRHDRVDPMYWFFLSSKLSGDDPNAVWLRVDEKMFRSYSEDVLITKEQLSNYSDEKGLRDTLPWKRPQLSLVEARYGPNAGGMNVTYKLMKIISEGQLPIEIQPRIFDLPDHFPAAWELTVFWRTADGERRATLRDGSVLNWP